MSETEDKYFQKIAQEIRDSIDREIINDLLGHAEVWKPKLGDCVIRVDTYPEGARLPVGTITKIEKSGYSTKITITGRPVPELVQYWRLATPVEIAKHKLSQDN